MRTYESLRTPRTEDQLLEERILRLKGIGRVQQSDALDGIGAGSGALAVSGVAQLDAAVVVRVSASGEPGDGVAAYELSLDGGQTFAAPVLAGTAEVAVGLTGARMRWIPGGDGGVSLVAGDTYSFSVSLPVFDATAWQEGSVPRRLLEVDGAEGADFDEAIAAVAQGASMRDARGPWATFHAREFYGEERRPAVFAEGRAVLSDVAHVGPRVVAPGELWAGNADGSKRYTNVDGGTVPLDGSLALTFQAEFAGVEYNLGNNELQLLTPIPGISIANPSRVTAVSKSRADSPDLSAAITSALGSDLDVIVSITTAGALGVAVFKYSVDGGLTWVLGVPTPPLGSYELGATGVTLTFGAGAYLSADKYRFQASVLWLARAGVDVESDEALAARCRRKWATLAVGLPAAALEFWALEASSEVAKVYVRPSPTVAGRAEVYVAGAAGAPSAEALAAVDAALQKHVYLPASISTQAATTTSIPLTGTVYCRAGRVAEAKANTLAALARLQADLPIGGERIEESRIVSREAIVGCITGGKNALGPVADAHLTAPAADVAVGELESPVFEPGGLNFIEA